MGYLSAKGDGQVALYLHIQPGAKQSKVAGIHDERLKISINAPPVDGKANKEVVRFLSDLFGIKKNQVRIGAGVHSRKKICLLSGLEEADIRMKLSSLL